MAGAALIAAPATGTGSYVSGAMLLEMCEPSVESHACATYIVGVLDAFDPAFGSSLYCAPPELDSLHAARVVADFMKSHREALHHDAPSLIYNPMLIAYPCPDPT